MTYDYKDADDRYFSGQLIEQILEYIETGNFLYLNVMLLSIEWNTAGPHVCGAAIRTTANYRKKLPNWEKACKIACERLYQLGHDPEKVLVGIIKGEE